MVVFGALIVGGFVAMFGLLVNYARMDREIMKKIAEKRRTDQPWNWD